MYTDHCEAKVSQFFYIINTTKHKSSPTLVHCLCTTEQRLFPGGVSGPSARRVMKTEFVREFPHVSSRKMWKLYDFCKIKLKWDFSNDSLQCRMYWIWGYAGWSWSWCIDAGYYGCADTLGVLLLDTLYTLYMLYYTYWILHFTQQCVLIILHSSFWSLS